MKGESTRAAILDAAMSVARLEGLEAISIGRLAAKVGLSKSGLFAHFKSKQTLQIQVIERAVNTFVAAVVIPAIQEPRGEPRVRALFENWLAWAHSPEIEGGCVFVGAAAELDDRPGKLRDHVVSAQKDWISTLATAVQISVQEGHFDTDTDAEQLAFEIYASMMAFHLYSRLLRDPNAEKRARTTFDALLASVGATN
jgi:AcrR family transcriptional regulator